MPNSYLFILTTRNLDIMTKKIYLLATKDEGERMEKYLSSLEN